MQSKVTMLAAGSALLAGALFLPATVQAGEPNPEVAKVIDEIAARRAAKEEAQVRQMETWQKREGQERVQVMTTTAGGGAVINIGNGVQAGATVKAAPGAPAGK